MAAAVLAVLLFLGGRALLGGDPVTSPSETVDPSVSAPAASASSPAPSASPSTFGAVPAELLDRDWLANDGISWQVGTLGAGPKSTLPADEYALGVDAGLVLSIDAEIGSTVFVREVDTGILVDQMETNLQIDDGVIRGDRFFLAGVVKDQDAGVWAGRIGEVGLVQLIPGSEGPLQGDRGTFRTGIKLSPTGRTLASTVCVKPACVTQISSTDGGPVLTIADSFARWVSEDFVLTTDSSLRAYGLDDGKLRWKLDDLRFWDGKLASDGRTLLAQAQSEDGNKEIWRVDTQTGGHEVIAALADDQYLVSELSNDRYVVVLAASYLGDALASGANFDVLDVTSGELVASQPFPRSLP